MSCNFAIAFILATNLIWEGEEIRPLKNEELEREKSLEKSKNVLEQKCKMNPAKILHKKRPTRLQ